MDQQVPPPFGERASKLETPPPDRAAMTGLLLTFRFCFTHCCHLLATRTDDHPRCVLLLLSWDLALNFGLWGAVH